MRRLYPCFLTFCLLCMAPSASFGQDNAQDNATAVQPEKSVASSPKAHVKKADRKSKKPQSPTAQSEDADAAARLAEARRKFFEQSSGFDDKNKDHNLSLGGSNGLTPGYGFKF